MRASRNRVFLGIVLYAVLMRITPYILQWFGFSIEPKLTFYPWNFSPMMALCIFGGAFYPKRWQAFAIPFVVMIVGDALIGLLTRSLGFALHPTTLPVYACYVLAIALGLLVRKKPTMWRGLAVGFVAEFIFFVVTNFGVWLNQDTYPQTAPGLVACYVAALPFFGRSLASTALYCGILFSPLAIRLTALLRDETEEPAIAVELATR